MPYVQNIKKIDKNDRPTATALIQSAFWTQTANRYQFTQRFYLLTADDLSILIKNVGDKKIARYIFADNYQEILSHYHRHDLIKLLSNFYSDAFALYVFEQFTNYLQCSILERQSFLQNISIAIMISVYKHNNIGQYFDVKELIICFKKIKHYITSGNNKGQINDCSVILATITRQIIDQNIQLLNADDIYFIYINHLVTKIELTLFMTELQHKILKMQKAVEDKDNLIIQYQYNIGTAIHKISEYPKLKENGKCPELANIKKELDNTQISLNQELNASIKLRKKHNYLHQIQQKILKSEFDRLNECKDKQKTDNELDELKNQNEAVVRGLNGMITVLQDENNQLISQINELKSKTSTYKQAIIAMQTNIDNCKNANNLLRQQMEGMMNDEKKSDDKQEDIFKTKFRDWFCSTVKLEQYLINFEQNQCNDVRMIEFLDDDTIKNDIGINNKLHRKLIMKQANQFKLLQVEFNNIIDGNKYLKKYKHIFQVNGILTLQDLQNDIQTKNILGKMLNIMDENKISSIWNVICSNVVENNEGQITEYI
eukprot:427966_1